MTEEKEIKKRISFDLSEIEHTKLKMHAASRGYTIKELIMQAVHLRLRLDEERLKDD